MAPQSPPPADRTIQKIAIVGAGAVGGFYGAKLAQHGNEVHFLFRRDLDHIRHHGLKIKSHDGDFFLSHPHVHGAPSEIGPSDLVIIALKATANTDLLELLPPLLHSGTILLTLQNGLGNEEFLAENFGAPRVRGGLCFVCLNRTAPGVIENFAHGNVAIGDLRGPPTEAILQIGWRFNKSGIDCRVVENLNEARWRKLVWNIPFNGLSIAGHNIDTQQILADPVLLARTRALMGEVIDSANCLGLTIPLSYAEEQVKRTFEMGGYKPSSLIDHLEGRPVEVEAIFGEPLRRGLAAGAKLPELEKLYNELCERTRRTAKKD